MINVVQKVWGSEEWLVNNELYCAKFLNLNKNSYCSIHWHKQKDETFYVLDGEIKLELFGETIYLSSGQSIRLKPYTVHRFTGITNSKILEISTTHSDEDSYRVIGSGTIE